MTQLHRLFIIPALLIMGLMPRWAVESSEQQIQKIEGVIQAMPAQRIGIWKIDGKEITVNSQTLFDENEVELKVGGYVVVELRKHEMIALEIQGEAPDTLYYVSI